MSGSLFNPFSDVVNRYRGNLDRLANTRTQNDTLKNRKALSNLHVIAEQSAHRSRTDVELDAYDHDTALKDLLRNINHMFSALTAFEKATNAFGGNFDRVSEIIRPHDYNAEQNDTDYDAALHLAKRLTKTEGMRDEINRTNTYIRLIQSYVSVWRDEAIDEINRLKAGFITSLQDNENGGL